MELCRCAGWRGGCSDKRPAASRSGGGSRCGREHRLDGAGNRQALRLRPDGHRSAAFGTYADTNVLRTYEKKGLQFHALRTRDAGARKFVSMHVLVPGDWTVKRGHKLLEQIEAKIYKVLPHVIVFTHLEPLNDPASWSLWPRLTVQSPGT